MIKVTEQLLIQGNRTLYDKLIDFYLESNFITQLQHTILYTIPDIQSIIDIAYKYKLVFRKEQEECVSVFSKILMKNFIINL